MNKYKKIPAVIIGVILAIVCLFAVNTFAASSGTCGSSITYTLDDNGTLTLSGTGAMPNYTYPKDVPWCSEKADITSVVIEEGITRIGNNAFYFCSNLSSAALPDSLTGIGTYAFYLCINLNNITLPDSLTSISLNAFRSCTSLTGIIIPDSVTNIGEEAFRSCTSLSSVTLPSSLKTIGYSAFYNCTSLTGITIPESVTSIGGSAFSGSGLTVVYCYEGSAADNASLYPDGAAIIYLNGSADEGDLEFTELTDAVRILRYADGTEILTEAEIKAADVNGDDAADEKDAAFVLKQLIFQ